MTAALVCELQRMHARWSRMARDAHRTYRDYPGCRSREERWHILELQSAAWAFAYAARIGMEQPDVSG